VGYQAGFTGQGQDCVAIGTGAGLTGQGLTALALGKGAGAVNQGIGCVAIGYLAGSNTQGSNGLALGRNAGYHLQGPGAVSVGTSAGYTFQGQDAIAIGTGAGITNQGISSIALGSNAGTINQADNSIVINATGNPVENTVANSLVITPVRDASSSNNQLLMYNGTEVVKSTLTTSSSSKTFVIPHPHEESKYLVHACLEGPESGVYYRGKSWIVSKSIDVWLPDYTSKFTDFTVQITPVWTGHIRTLNCGEVYNGKFTVYGEKGPFHWVVQAKRSSICVEPSKADVTVLGDGPYRYIQ
jgi:hypothetical protein